MDTVVFADKKYIKASKAALASGYTADYVGQLCRKGKIDAVLLGKTWYVHEDSLTAHKQNSDRANVEVTRKDVRKQREELSTQDAPRTNVASESAHWRRLLETPISYSSESDDLIPSPVRARSSDEDESAAEKIEAEEVIHHAPILPESQEENADETPVKPENDEISVAIRKDVSETRVNTKTHQSHVLREIKHTKKKNEDLQTIPEVQAIVVRRSLAPMVLTVSMLVLLLLNIFAEIRWTYSVNGQESAVMEAHYNLASIADIVQNIEKN